MIILLYLSRVQESEDKMNTTPFTVPLMPSNHIHLREIFGYSHCTLPTSLLNHNQLPQLDHVIFRWLLIKINALIKIVVEPMATINSGQIISRIVNRGLRLAASSDTKTHPSNV